MWDWLSELISGAGSGLASLFTDSASAIPDGGFGLDFSPAALDFTPPEAAGIPTGGFGMDTYDPTMTMGDLYRSADANPYQPTTWNNYYNGVTNSTGDVLGSSAALANLAASGGNVARAMDALRRAGEAMKPGGGSGSVTMPNLSTPTADKISALAVPQVPQAAVPQSAPATSSFKPVVVEPAPVVVPQGLARVFGESTDPYADIRAQLRAMRPRGGF